MTLGCFLCSGADHWADACWTLKPPASRDHHEARIATFTRWCTGELPDPPRITPHQKRALIEAENAMWKKAQKEKEKAK